MASIFGLGGDDIPLGAAPFGKYDQRPTYQQEQPPTPVTSEDVRPRIASTMPATQQLPYQPSSISQGPPSYASYESRHSSYMDRLWSHKRDISKLLLLALTVSVALAIHGVGKFLLKTYLTAHELTFNQEVMLRSAYPLVILFFVWNLKVSMSSK